MKKTIIAVGMLFAMTMSATIHAQESGKKENEEGFVFTTVKENPITSIKNQNRAGTCWCYSTMAFLESELLRMGKGEYDLSEMFTVYNTYLDRADAAVRTHGDVSFSQGGSFYDVIYGMEAFGLVPEEEMRPGVMYVDTLSNHTELSALADAMVAAVAKGKLRKLQSDENNAMLWKKAVAAVHEIYLGKAPEKFTYKGKEYTYTGEIIQKAEKRPLDKERIREALMKSGDVPFKLNIVDFTEFEDGFMRISDLNNLRRDAIENLIKNICKESRRRRPAKKNIVVEKTKSTNDCPTELYSCVTKEQLKALLECNVKNIAFDIFSREANALRFSDIIDTFEKYNGNINLYIKTSSIIKGEFDKVCTVIEKVKSYIKGIITSNIGIIHLYRNSLQIIGDYKLNIMNTQSLEFYQSEISIPTLSMELNRTEIKDILRKNKGNNAYVIYGKPELMISEYCPIGSTFGGRKTNVDCNAICTRDKFTLIDRVNERLRVMTDLFCRSYILNPVPLNLFDERTYLKEAGIKTLRFDFRDESYEEVKNVYNMYLGKMEYDKSNYTKGQFRRGIE